MEEQIVKIKEVLYGYEKAGLIDNDPEKVLSYLTDDIMGIGMGEQGFVSSKKDILDIMLYTTKKDTDSVYELEFEDTTIRFISDTFANLCTKVYVRRKLNGNTTTSGFMQSLSLTLKNREWYICSLHASPIMLTEEGIESYPMTFADNTLNQLRTELQGEAFRMVNQSLSGGVLGTYISEHYPICFANDALLKMLGYERKEFEEKFKDGFDKVVPEEEQIRLYHMLKDKKNNSKDFAARIQWLKKDGERIWVEFRTHKAKDDKGTDIYLTVVIEVSEIVNLQLEAKKQTQTILSSIRYASKIQKNILPFNSTFEKSFSDYAIGWFPKDIVGGDLYWIKNFEAGTVLAVCDCTGHGVPGALLTILVSSILDAIVNKNNCMDTDCILLELDQKINLALSTDESLNEAANAITQIKDGCDIALLFISKNKNITLSTSNIPVFICNGKEVKQIKGQRIHIGDGKLLKKEDVIKITIQANENNKYYIATDGLYDQIGGEGLCPFGYKKMKDIILEYHTESQKRISGEIWKSFETYRGENVRRDDVELVTFKP